ncbi:MAG: BsaA family SipW-dependent biofilm matrix protein [Oscillospiraceae bacterium]
MTKRKKNTREKRALVGALCTAAVIVAGSTFAWFTSSDEVTNRLTASANYGVSLVEDFTPPEDMVPGQEVNKDVSAVNTGSIDAVVRTWIGNKINYTRIGSKDATSALTTGTTDYFTDGNTVNSVARTTATAQASAPGGYPTYLYTKYVFDTAKVTADSGTELIKLNAHEYTDANGVKHANEVTTLQAGGQLVVAENKSVAPNTEFAQRSGDDQGASSVSVMYTDSTNYYWYDATSSTYKGVTKNADGTYTKQNTALASQPAAGNLKVFAVIADYSGENQYRPAETGLYIFRRYEKAIADTTADTTGNYTYAGYFYDGTDFYALKEKTATTTGSLTNTYTTLDATITTDANGVVNSISDLKFATKEALTTASGAFTITAGKYENSTFTAFGEGQTVINALKVVFTKTATPADSNLITIYIKLAENVNADTSKWAYVSGTPKADNGTNDENAFGFFYLKKPLAAGETSAKLVDSVILDKNMTSANFLDLTYDLDLKLESVQISKDTNGNETLVAVPNTWARATGTNKASTTPTKIESISWS